MSLKQRFSFDTSQSQHKSIAGTAPEKLLILIRTDQIGQEIFYHGTPLGKFLGFGIEQVDGVKKIYAEVEITNERNWGRFDTRPEVLPRSFASENGVDKGEGALFSMRVSEKLDIFHAPE